MGVILRTRVAPCPCEMMRGQGRLAMSSDSLHRHAQTGIAEMDQEHALELQIVRSIQAALQAADSEKVNELLQQLEDFTNAHFLAEQLLMRLHAYPDYEAHQEEHDRLMTELKELSQNIQADVSQDPAGDAVKLERWLVDHMSSSDLALAEYLKEENVQP